MKVLIIGGNGLIGSKVAEHLSKKHDIVRAGRTSGDQIVDIADSTSIETIFQRSAKYDAILCIAGETKWNSFEGLTEEDYYVGIRSKLMGQVNLVRIAKDYINDDGSFTLTSGILADDPVPMTASAAMVNGGLHSFVKATALELKRGIRINVVSAGLVEDAVSKYESFFPGHNPVSMTKVINAYVKSVEGKINGQIIRAYD
jgi:NAD(P)-dependent dehydrogenase (short-subunit alcohol dehydrogenase family)